MSKADRASTPLPTGNAIDRKLPAIASDPSDLALPAAAHVANLRASLQLRTMELIGLAEDGRMFLWSTGDVQPVSAFETVMYGRVRGIRSGHYVIDVAGHAIVVHCGALTDGGVSVQFMCRRGPVLRVSRQSVEAILLGRVIPDPVKQAEISKLLHEITEVLVARNQAPHRARGAIA